MITSRAQSDLAECVGFVFKDPKEAGRKLAKDIYSSIESLGAFPERNAVFPMPKSFPNIVRKLVIDKPYLVLYAVAAQRVIVYRILDARRKLNNLIA
ncbi:MAG: type II toxin-antitoxin system RelE/ParE family toxin [Bacilli bacterium]|nr:type II toxin-antitoxin system RelE/ParE family toxin [Bacilli bacterium]